MLAAVIFVLAGATAVSAEEADEPEANPGRPTVSTPAAVAPTGYLQFETGVLTARHSPEFSSRSSAIEVLKLSVSSRLEFLASFEPLVHYRTEGRKANGIAEVFCTKAKVRGRLSQRVMSGAFMTVVPPTLTSAVLGTP